mmetsp:Transcript_40232/g.94235  ORF Transcript_40232/g.94235 Transcript_40232/m.94235 type:complete len:248 (-) Transcript_40232:152-895(-)
MAARAVEQVVETNLLVAHAQDARLADAPFLRRFWTETMCIPGILEHVFSPLGVSGHDHPAVDPLFTILQPVLVGQEHIHVLLLHLCGDAPEDVDIMPDQRSICVKKHHMRELLLAKQVIHEEGELLPAEVLPLPALDALLPVFHTVLAVLTLVLLPAGQLQSWPPTDDHGVAVLPGVLAIGCKNRSKPSGTLLVHLTPVATGIHQHQLHDQHPAVFLRPRINDQLVLPSQPVGPRALVKRQAILALG